MEGKWKNLCWAASTTDSKCNQNAWMSPLRFLDGKDPSDLDQAQIDQAFWTSFIDKSKAFTPDQEFHDSYLYPNREHLTAHGSVTFLRAIINFGAPLNIDDIRYKNVNDKWSE